jgi:hypothetical protein
MVGDVKVHCLGKDAGLPRRLPAPAAVAQPALKSGDQGMPVMLPVFSDKMEVNILPIGIL